mmetsp:Transcript_8839/g.23980  ORF Transcript_8839/g.23980 Transcript_8839/m.23980 type:complete len:259 (+) Transcript_8839:381-1157(+)
MSMVVPVASSTYLTYSPSLSSSRPRCSSGSPQATEYSRRCVPGTKAERVSARPSTCSCTEPSSTFSPSTAALPFALIRGGTTTPRPSLFAPAPATPLPAFPFQELAGLPPVPPPDQGSAAGAQLARESPKLTTAAKAVKKSCSSHSSWTKSLRRTMQGRICSGSPMTRQSWWSIFVSLSMKTFAPVSCLSCLMWPPPAPMMALDMRFVTVKRKMNSPGSLPRNSAPSLGGFFLSSSPKSTIFGIIQSKTLLMRGASSA